MRAVISQDEDARRLLLELELKEREQLERASKGHDEAVIRNAFRGACVTSSSSGSRRKDSR